MDGAAPMSSSPDPPADLVEGRIHVAIPWNWIRSIGDVMILRWFPPTPIPRNAS
ncbi:MAG: hypothetical protein CM1200mP21_04320 [Candidatus Poseidoniales archaeon]|nr:MAG: hypothetical protein CM1200mP21_04320 [Candidatus Poseidoniales archaeon]